jgi:hypothetical protein
MQSVGADRAIYSRWVCPQSDSPFLRLMMRVAEQPASIAAATPSRLWTVQERTEESCGMTQWNDDGEWIISESRLIERDL